MKEHKLKIWPSAYDDTKSKKKTFEFRKNDRDFALGDVLILKEYDPSEAYLGRYTGRQTTVKVVYILYGVQFGIPPGYVVMGIELNN